MDKNFKKLSIISVIALGLTATSIYAATPVNLSKQKVTALQTMVANPGLAGSASTTGLKEISRNVDINKTLHIRSQQMFAGYKVWGAQAIVHVPNGNASLGLAAAAHSNAFMNGKIYKDLSKDLGNAPAAAQADKAIESAVANYQHKVGGQVAVEQKESELVVFVDKANKAHWAYRVKFYVPATKDGQMPSKPVAIVDAATLTVYKHWDDIQTIESVKPAVRVGGGFGGNKKMGKLTYDGLTGDLPRLKVSRDSSAHSCLMKNDDVTVEEYRSGRVSQFNCDAKDTTHNSTYWNGEFHKVNDGYSPDNDALFGGAVIKNMYKKWYGLDVLTEDGKPMMLTMVVHDPIDNAYWDGEKMTFGDGEDYFYPLTSIGVASHEISHGFTQQHSDLEYWGMSGGMNEAFSDMAAQAAEYFAYGKNSWQIGPEIVKEDGVALRYMDQPSKDCPPGREPGDWCSIDDATQYSDDIDVHFTSGVYNRLFYLMGTSKNWNARKAFNVMVHANMNYWTSDSTFEEGACGVLQATKDLGYGLSPVKKALRTVKIDISDCELK